jgi:DNA-binding NarL/FixJ family response regulator
MVVDMNDATSHSLSAPASREEGGDRQIAVMVVDDHPAVRAGVSRLLADQFDMHVVVTAATALQAIHIARVDVTVVDYHLGDRTGLWVTGALRRTDPPPRVLIYSAFSDEALAIAAVIAGADGLLSKSAIADELCTAVRRIAGGGVYLPRLSMTVAHAMSARVDPRLRPVFGMLVQGIGTDRVEEALQISGEEMEVARARILRVVARDATRGHPGGTSRVVLDDERPRHGWRPSLSRRVGG